MPAVMRCRSGAARRGSGANQSPHTLPPRLVVAARCRSCINAPRSLRFMRSAAAMIVRRERVITPRLGHSALAWVGMSISGDL